MRKALTAAMAALTFGGIALTAALPANAQPRGYYRDYRYDRHRDRDSALAAGVVGLALGAAIAGNNRSDRYYGGGYYDRGYYGPPPRYYGPPPRYRTCETNRWVWDPYIGRRVMVRDRYRC